MEYRFVKQFHNWSINALNRNSSKEGVLMRTSHLYAPRVDEEGQGDFLL